MTWIPEIPVGLAEYAAYGHDDTGQTVAGLPPRADWAELAEFPFGGHRVAPAAVADHLRAAHQALADGHPVAMPSVCSWAGHPGLGSGWRCGLSADSSYRTSAALTR